MEKGYKEKQLDYALKGIMSELVAYGFCESERTSELGFRTAETLRLSVDGATLIFDLVKLLSNSYVDLLNEMDKSQTK